MIHVSNSTIYLFFVTFFYNIASDNAFNLNTMSYNFDMTISVVTCYLFPKRDYTFHIHMKQ